MIKNNPMEKLDPNKDGASPNMVAENIERLRELFPEIVADGKIDFDALRETLGDTVDDRQERYSFSWHGKSRAHRIAQTPSTGTLLPCPEESVNWETTKNIFIEGDNLEVLKLLQKSYHRKVKMIYIDPPYNTGHDFIYPDDFRDSLANYKRITGQVDGQGRPLNANLETSGRYHTDWLNMMYPRLRLARSLLADDGVILISIDDGELSNLRKLCDEVFGEETFVGQLTWLSTTQPDNIGKARFGLQKNTEYILLYARCHQQDLPPFKLQESGVKKTYPHVGKHGKCRFEIIERAFDGAYARPTMRFQILGQAPRDGKQWQIGESAARHLEQEGKIETIDGVVKRAVYPDDEKPSYVPFWSHLTDVGTSQKGKAALTDLLESSVGFETVKPVALVKKLLSYFGDESVVLDFFAGSGTTGQAVLEMNRQDQGNRRFILVQLPESFGKKTGAYDNRFGTVAEIGKERIRRAARRMYDPASTPNRAMTQDTGFKVFKLSSSNIKQWDAEFDTIEQDLLGAVENIKPGRTKDDVLYELLLKYGLDLAIPIESRTISGKKVHIIGAGALVVCLATGVNLDVVRGIAALKAELNPEVMRVVFRDASFKDDVVKTNTVQILKQAGIDDVKSL